MRVAHTAKVTPHRAGLYETARDLVAAERRAGVDARIVDPVTEGLGLIEDRGVPIAGMDFFEEADVVVSHSGLSKEMNAMVGGGHNGGSHKGGPYGIIHVLHGRPHSSFLLEQCGKINVYSYLAAVGKDPRFKAFVTFWPSFLPYWSVILPEGKLRAVTPPVDLELWTPEGPRGYKFHGHRAEINVVCASMWREDETPYHIIHAFHHAVEGLHELSIKLHMYAAPQKGSGWAVLRKALEDKGVLGEVLPMVNGLANVYRAADVAITPHRIATRSVREPLACGCNVVMGKAEHAYTPFQADPQDTSAYAIMIMQAVRQQADNRMVAQTWFDPAESAREMIELFQEVLNGRE